MKKTIRVRRADEAVSKRVVESFNQAATERDEKAIIIQARLNEDLFMIDDYAAGYIEFDWIDRDSLVEVGTGQFELRGMIRGEWVDIEVDVSRPGVTRARIDGQVYTAKD